MIFLRECICEYQFPGDLKYCPKCGELAELFGPAETDQRDYSYDVETYPTIFTCNVIHIPTDARWRFEISDWKNEYLEFCDFLTALRNCRARMVGFNNEYFDYPVIHYILQNPGCTPYQIYLRADAIINSKDPFQFSIWPRDRYVEQVDLFKIKHFDNKRAGLKDLEFCMRMDSVEDLPFEPGTYLTEKDAPVLHHYNEHDNIATAMFYARCISSLKLREELTRKHGEDFTNYNDTKIGKQYLIGKLEKSGIKCFERINGKRQKRQTPRHKINLGEVIFPYIRLETPEFRGVQAQLAAKIVTKTKDAFEKIKVVVQDCEYVIGTGGLHASVNSQIISSSATHQIVDVDVTSFYPKIGIQNKVYPEHLGVEFCDILEDVFQQRKSFPKGTSENEMMKLALNGVYGDTGSPHSVFLDPRYTMSITINGQLLLLSLAEQMLKIPGLRIIQCNTDGVTFLCPRQFMDHQRDVQRWWEVMSQGLTLEESTYKRMFVKDVNNYMAEKENGSVKRIGSYAIETAEENPATRELLWHKDWSARVVPMAAQHALVHGGDFREFIVNHQDDYDFLIKSKVDKKSNTVMRWPEYDNVEIPLPRIVRYYISNGGGTLTKVSPPTGVPGSWKRKPGLSDSEYNKIVAEIKSLPPSPNDLYDSTGFKWDPRINTKNQSRHEIRDIGISAGYRVTECNDIRKFDRKTINYDYYIAETEKLVNPLLHGG